MKKRIPALLLAALMTTSAASAKSIYSEPIGFEGTTLLAENTPVEIDPDGDGQGETVELRASFDTDSRYLTAVVTDADGSIHEYTTDLCYSHCDYTCDIDNDGRTALLPYATDLETYVDVLWHASPLSSMTIISASTSQARTKRNTLTFFCIRINRMTGSNENSGETFAASPLFHITLHISATP